MSDDNEWKVAGEKRRKKPKKKTPIADTNTIVATNSPQMHIVKPQVQKNVLIRTHERAVELKNDVERMRLVSANMSQQIKSARNMLGWSQAKLAEIAQVGIGIVRGYENCSCVPVHDYTMRLSRALCVQLKN